MVDAFAKAVAQLGDRRILKLVAACVLLSIAVFVGLWLLVGVLLINSALFETAWLETAVDLFGGLATLALTWLLFPTVVSAVVCMFLEGVARAVEVRHYPELPPAEGLGVFETIATSVRFLIVLVVLNLALLVFLVVPPVFPFAFYAVNGYLLGREYFELVALRRLNSQEVRVLRRRRRGPLFLVGVMVAWLLTLPLVNLVVPIVATAAMVHLFEGWRRTA